MIMYLSVGSVVLTMVFSGMSAGIAFLAAWADRKQYSGVQEVLVRRLLNTLTAGCLVVLYFWLDKMSKHVDSLAYSSLGSWGFKIPQSVPLPCVELGLTVAVYATVGIVYAMQIQRSERHLA